MFNSWFHIRLLSRFLQSTLEGVSLGKPFTYRKGELHIPISGCNQFECLHFSTQAPLPLLNIEQNLPKPKNRVPILTKIEGKHISQILLHKSDRQILFDCNKENEYLLFQIFGINGNVFHLDTNFKIIDSFKKATKASVPQKTDFISQDNLILDYNLLLKIAADNQDKTISQFLSSISIPIYSRTLKKEIFFRSKLNPSTLIANLRRNDLEILIDQLQNILNEISKPTLAIYFSSPPIFSLISLHFMQNTGYENFNDLYIASRTFISTYFKWKTLTEKKKTLSRRLETSIFSLQKKLNRQIKDIKNLPTADTYRGWADTILANLHKIEKVTSMVTLPQMDDTSEKISIPLNLKLTPAENAQKYYGKSRHIDSSRKNLLLATEQTRNSIAKITSSFSAVENATEIKHLRKIEKELPTEIPNQNLSQQGTIHLPYYKFILGKWEILVGRGARDNDVLTFKVSRPNDFWFHAQNVTGSHVILRNPQKLASLPKSIIEKTAGIAAFYCKAKHSGIVPVVYTLRKYVWKRKNSPLGTVSLKFEKSVIVEPFNPKKH
ncbi:MAG: DUF814 domain-containing protein [Candidatus Marinimicrobia bacterium]|nr:DUF814 domain-containing protein [Candidatus Neomarinimicrobiota bacterium]